MVVPTSSLGLIFKCSLINPYVAQVSKVSLNDIIESDAGLWPA